jgi:hypothetical protein
MTEGVPSRVWCRSPPGGVVRPKARFVDRRAALVGTNASLCLLGSVRDS